MRSDYSLPIRNESRASRLNRASQLLDMQFPRCIASTGSPQFVHVPYQTIVMWFPLFNGRKPPSSYSSFLFSFSFDLSSELSHSLSLSDGVSANACLRPFVDPQRGNIALPFFQNYLSGSLIQRFSPVPLFILYCLFFDRLI